MNSIFLERIMPVVLVIITITLNIFMFSKEIRSLPLIWMLQVFTLGFSIFVIGVSVILWRNY